MSLLLRNVSNCHILKTRPPKNKLFTQVCSTENSCKKFQITTIFDRSCDQNRKKPMPYKASKSNIIICLMLHMGLINPALLYKLWGNKHLCLDFLQLQNVASLMWTVILVYKVYLTRPIYFWFIRKNRTLPLFFHVLGISFLMYRLSLELLRQVQSYFFKANISAYKKRHLALQNAPKTAIPQQSVVNPFTSKFVSNMDKWILHFI